MRLTLFLALLCGTGLNATMLHAQASRLPANTPPVLGVGDAIEITVWTKPDMSGEFDIAEDGTVLHPLYRSIRVAGMTQPQAEAAVRTVLQRFSTTPEFVVEPLFRVAVAGEVRSPNVYLLPAQTTLAQALTQAGGPSPLSTLKHVRLVRNGVETRLDLTTPSAAVAELRVRSGDQIILDPRRNIWSDRVRPLITTVGSIASIMVIFIRLSDY